MRIVEIIQKKRDKKELTKEEIAFFVKGYTAGEIPDYQASALLMACFLNGLSEEETSCLTMEMMNSGDVLSLPFSHTVDKHSTGGVGDGVSLAIAPIVAAAGGKVAMMSGRGLGHTGGTLDKLDSIEGYDSALSVERFFETIGRVGCSIIGQTERLAPADKKLYALRDATGTVECKELITASILSKKLAEGVESLVLDVKTGSGAFMKKKEDAIELAEMMVKICKRMGRKVVAFVTDMDRPLGNKVGNLLEVQEAIEALQGRAPEDYMELTVRLSEEMLVLCGVATREQAKARVMEVIENGSALRTFREMAAMQGGNAELIDHPECFSKAKYNRVVYARESGYISRINAEGYGVAALLLGAGRNKKEDKIIPEAGIEILKKTGDCVEKGQPIAILYANNVTLFEESERRLHSSVEYSSKRVEKSPLFLAKID
ncbi:MAG: thymidine phosphorylase [Clostridia bacterium]|nr:thymidine phosphorylase [Clostridia bacterium]